MEMKSLRKPIAFAFLLVAASLAVAPFTAKAQIASTDAARYLAILPPVEYDHAYHGQLNLVQLSDEGQALPEDSVTRHAGLRLSCSKRLCDHDRIR